MSKLDYRADKQVDKIAFLLTQLYSDRDMIAEALKHGQGTHTFDDVAMMILTNKLIYWHLDNSCIIGEVIVYPQRKDLHFFISAGDLKEITAMQPQMIKTAEALGCSSLSITGRPGWKKSLGALGWEVHSTNMWLDLTKPIVDDNPIDLFVDRSFVDPNKGKDDKCQVEAKAAAKPRKSSSPKRSNKPRKKTSTSPMRSRQLDLPHILDPR